MISTVYQSIYYRYCNVTTISPLQYHHCIVNITTAILYCADITVKGLEAVRTCDRIYLEAYTSILMVDRERLVLFLASLSRSLSLCLPAWV